MAPCSLVPQPVTTIGSPLSSTSRISWANPRAAALAQLILDVDESGEPIVVTGCGTSEHGAMAVAELLDAALRQRGARGGRVEARQALEAALDPRAGGLCIAVTESGGTRATMLAVEAARDVGAATAAIT